MEYTANLITNGEANSLSGWSGAATLERNTFKINSGGSLSQTVPLRSNAELCVIEAECLPDSAPDGIVDVRLVLEYAYGTDITVVMPYD